MSFYRTGLPIGDDGIYKRSGVINCLNGSLINQILDDGTLLGGDYNGRLGPLTLWINSRRDLFEGKSILDLGSNAGHFPIEYIRAGAEHVTAVEGRLDFRKQWNKIKDRIPNIDTTRIKWHTTNVRNFTPDNNYDVISCLGLIYHMTNPWTEIVRLISDSVKTIIIESEIFHRDRKDRVATDRPDHRSKSISHESVYLASYEDVVHTMINIFSGWTLHPLWYYTMIESTEWDNADEIRIKGKWNPKIPILEKVQRPFIPLVGFSARLALRACWYLTRDKE